MGVIIRSGIIVVGILFIRKLGMGKISRKLQYYMWGMLPFVLLIYPYFQIPVPNIGEYENKPLAERYDEVSYVGENTLGEIMLDGEFLPDYLEKENTLEKQEENNFVNVNQDKESEKSQIKIGWEFLNDKNVLESIRKIVMIDFLCFIAMTNSIFAVKLAKKRVFLKKDERTNLNIYLLEECSSPFLFGKSIYLHPDMTKNKESMNYMILHEYCHLRQGDLFFNLVKYILCAVYWFDPFVWVGVHFINRDCELSCDEAVIKLIGTDKQQEYGMTLLELFKRKRRNQSFVIGTSMGGKRSMLRERIRFLSKPLNKKKGWTLGVLAGCVLLMGCSLIGNNASEKQQDRKELVIDEEEQGNINESTNKSSNEKLQLTFEDRHSTAKIKGESSNEVVLNSGNNYYNSTKEYNGKLYFIQSGYLCDMDLDSKNIRQLDKGNFKLGNVNDDYLYYLKNPAESKEKAGVGRINLTTMEQEILIPWDEVYWSCTEIFVQDNILYLGLEKECKAFSLNQGNTVELDQNDNLIINAVSPFAELMEEAPTVNFGYINSIFNFHVFTAKDSKTNSLYICNTKEKISVKKENCLGDVLICERGIVYTSLNGDIYLSPLDHLEEDNLLFSVEENGYSVTYGTYD